MGGPGSGNRGRWSAKTSTAACHRVDLASLRRDGGLRAGSAGTIRWLRGERVTSSIGWTVVEAGGIATALELRYAVGAEVIAYRVPLAWTACRFGGQRPWFVCPGEGCGRRVGVLYGRYLFLCRHCHDLAYESTRQSPGGRALRRTQRIRGRLGGSANLLTPLPSKPKGMHWRTYERLLREAVVAEGAYHTELTDWLERQTAWLDRIAGDRGEPDDRVAPKASTRS